MNWGKFLMKAKQKKDTIQIATLIDIQGTRWEHVKFKEEDGKLYLENGRIINREDVIIQYEGKE